MNFRNPMTAAKYLAIFATLIFAFQNCAPFESVLTDEFVELSSEAPQVSLVSAPEEISRENSAHFEISTIANKYSQISRVECQLDDAEPAECAGTLDIADLQDGFHALVIVAIDNRGNQSSPIVFTWLVDTLQPTLVFTTPPPTVTGVVNFNSAFAVADSGSGVATLTCTLNGAPINCENGQMAFTNLTEGPHALAITVLDRAGNTLVVNRNFAVDLSAPTVNTLTGPANPTSQTTANFQFTGVDDGVAINQFECALDDGDFVRCDNGVATYNNLQEGMRRFQVRAMDLAGNRSAPREYNWAIDLTSPPAPTITAVDYTSQSTAVVTFSSTDPASGGVQSGVDPATGYTCTRGSQVINNCQSPLSLNLIANQPNTLSIVARDRAGNNSAAGTKTVVHDNTQPAITLNGPPSMTNQTSASITFTVTDANIQTVTCRLNNQLRETCISPTLLTNLAPGTYSFQVMALDRAGNQSSRAHTWSVSEGSTDPLPPTPGDVVLLEDFATWRDGFGGDIVKLFDVYNGNVGDAGPNQQVIGVMNNTFVTTQPANNVYYVDQDDAPYTQPNQWMRGHIKSGTWNPAINRMVFMLRSTLSHERPNSGSDNMNVGTYVKPTNNFSRGAEGSNPQNGHHYYHGYSTPMTAGKWIKVYVTNKNQHERGDPGSVDGIVVENYFDQMTRFYIQNWGSYPGPASTWELSPIYLYTVSGEPDADISSQTIQHNGNRYQVTWASRKNVDVTFEVRYRLDGVSLKSAGFNSGIDGGTARSTGNDYTGVYWELVAPESPNGIYVGIRVRGASQFSELYLPYMPSPTNIGAGR